MNEIYNRLLQIIESKGFKSVNDFALRGLEYKSSEKLNRLKKSGTTPGWDILHDISNKFVDVNLNWFVSGIGEPFKIGMLGEPPAPKYGLEKNNDIVEVKNEIIDLLKKENEELRTDKEFFRDLLKSKFLTP